MQFQEEFLKKHDYYAVISLLLQKGEKVRMNLYGYCMSPFIRHGEDVTISPVKYEDLRCGDIIVYRNEDRFKIHRFLWLITIANTTYIVSRGDRAINPDPPVPLHLLLGKVTLVHRGDKVIDFETPLWKTLNFIMGKLSPYQSKVRTISHFPRRCASRIFYLVMGTNYRAYIENKRNIRNRKHSSTLEGSSNQCNIKSC
jgi:hypothetical protein